VAVRRSTDDSGAGYETVVAADGDEGLRAYREHRPYLVVLDLKMPRRTRWDAFEATVRSIRSRWRRLLKVPLAWLEISSAGMSEGGYCSLPLPRWLMRAALKSSSPTAAMMKWTR